MCLFESGAALKMSVGTFAGESDVRFCLGFITLSVRLLSHTHLDPQDIQDTHILFSSRPPQTETLLGQIHGHLGGAKVRTTPYTAFEMYPLFRNIASILAKLLDDLRDCENTSCEDWRLLQTEQTGPWRIYNMEGLIQLDW